MMAMGGTMRTTRHDDSDERHDDGNGWHKGAAQHDKDASMKTVMG